MSIASAARPAIASWVLVGATALAVLLSVMVSLTLGPAGMSVGDVLGVIVYRLGLSGQPPDQVFDAIVWHLRFPRAITAAAVGAGLALCGTVLQAVIRNPLADPYLLGLSAGASLGAVSVLSAGLMVLLPLAAFAGSAAALLATLGLALSLGALSPTRTILAGVAVAAMAGALTSFVIFSTATGDVYRDVLTWLMGSLGGARWPEVLLAVGALLVIGTPMLFCGHVLDAFSLGDTAAAALGIRIQASRIVLLLAAALLTGSMVAVSGSIGFVGLVVPHALRLLLGSRHRLLLPLAALSGAGVLVWSDAIARTAFAPQEVPVGVVTALVGGPAFALLLWINRRRTL